MLEDRELLGGVLLQITQEITLLITREEGPALDQLIHLAWDHRVECPINLVQHQIRASIRVLDLFMDQVKTTSVRIKEGPAVDQAIHPALGHTVEEYHISLVRHQIQTSIRASDLVKTTSIRIKVLLRNTIRAAFLVVRAATLRTVDLFQYIIRIIKELLRDTITATTLHTSDLVRYIIRIIKVKDNSRLNMAMERAATIQIWGLVHSRIRMHILQTWVVEILTTEIEMFLTTGWIPPPPTTLSPLLSVDCPQLSELCRY